MDIILLTHSVVWLIGVIVIVGGGVAIIMLAAYLIWKKLGRRRGESERQSRNTNHE